MDAGALERYRRRVEAIDDVAPIDDSTLDRWIVVPLLSTLGWDDRSIRTVDDVAGVSYVLTTGSSPTPGVFVSATVVEDRSLETVDGTSESPVRSTIERLRTTMAKTGVERGLVVDVDRVSLLVGDDHHVVAFASLPDRMDLLSRFTPPAIDERRRALEPADVAARRLLIARGGLREELAATVERQVGESVPGVDEHAARFVDALIGVLIEGESRTTDVVEGTGRQEVQGRSRPTASHRDDGSAQADRPVEDPVDPNASLDDEVSTPVEPDHAFPERVEPADDETGEFVARFFDDRTSIGAIGNSTSAGALREVTNYLLERGLRGVRYPWPNGDDGDEVVLAEEPTDWAGEPWAAYERLQNDRYVKTSGSVGDRADRVRQLASRAGLRVMLTGDWDTDDGDERDQS